MASFFDGQGEQNTCSSSVDRKNPKDYTIEAVLITASRPTEDLVREQYFNRILTLSDLFGER